MKVTKNKNSRLKKDANHVEWAKALKGLYLPGFRGIM